MIEPKLRPCPICKKLEDQRFRPFCSKRCADIDLGKWLNESYSIPADETVPDVTKEDP